MIKNFEIIEIYSEEFSTQIKAIVVDNELFDWGIDLKSLNQAKEMIEKHQEMAESVSMSIINHFLECFSDFIGKNYTLNEIIEAIQNGFIEV